MSLAWVFQLFGSWISKSGKFLLKLRVHHLGKFTPKESNPLYTAVILICGNLELMVLNTSGRLATWWHCDGPGEHKLTKLSHNVAITNATTVSR